MIIIGITGTNGSGKGAVVQYLKKIGFSHYSVRNFLIKKLKEKNIEINRTSMRENADKLRQKFSPSYLIEEISKEILKENKDCVIESIRCPGEIDFLRKFENFYLFSVDANIKTRFQRIQKRQSYTDKVDFKDFIKQENAELNNNEPFKMNILKCIQLSDYKFINDKSFSYLNEQINMALGKIKNEKK